MIVAKVPKIEFPRSSKEEVPFIVWDPALEALLSTPITKELTTPKVNWKPSTALSHAKITSIAVRRPGTAPATPKMHVEENSDLKSREIMIHKMITSPLSPRKATKVPAHRKQHKPKNHSTIENIMYERSTKSIPVQDFSTKKVEKQSLVRQFSIPIRRGVRTPNPFS